MKIRMLVFQMPGNTPQAFAWMRLPGDSLATALVAGR
jgi:hypothetical protein